MKERKKVFVLLPDGIGLKNFAYSDFQKVGVNNGFEVVYWNKTTFNLSELGFKEIKLPGLKPYFLSVILKNAKTSIFLDYFTKKFNDDTYQSYKFKPYKDFTSLPDILKSLFYRFFLFLFNNRFRNSIQFLIHFLERKTNYYQACRSQLLNENPDFILCTNQRHISAISPLLAARDLNIPTSTFIFSWDNLPKATLVVDVDYYFVWSEYMKEELLSYYSNIRNSQVKIVGTPQFEFYYNASNILPEEDFYQRYKMNKDWDYICFSGDDITTSPYDAYYLNDLAFFVSELNLVRERKIGIIFRRCPVDFSDRYDFVLNDFKDIIVSIDPVWKAFGDSWNEIMPLPDDIKILTSTIYYSKAVFNLGSSMVFDFVSFNKPCFYFNYNPFLNSSWSVYKVYKYIHFKSMPSKNAVFWIDSRDDIYSMLLEFFTPEYHINLKDTELWFQKIVSVPPNSTSSLMWDSISEIV